MLDDTAADVARRHLSHELRGPLTVAIGRLQLVRRRLDQGRDPGSLSADLAQIELALVRLASAVDRIDPR